MTRQRGGSFSQEMRQAFQYRENHLLEGTSCSQTVATLSLTGLSLRDRTEETLQLLQALERVRNGPSETILVHGSAGSGKTTLVQTLRKQSNVIFVSGKYDSLASRPYAAFVDCFTELCTAILQSHLKTDIIMSINAKLRDDARLLIDLIPKLTELFHPITEKPIVVECSSGSILRFRRAVRAFVRVVSEHLHFVMFHDDLHFADKSSLELFSFLASDTESTQMLIIGSFREDEENLSLDKCVHLLRYKVGAARIKMNDLDFEDTNELIAEALGMPTARTEALTMLVHRTTQGNCLFILQVLAMLLEQGFLRYSEQRQWTYDVQRIVGDMEMPTSLDDVVSERLMHLPSTCLNILSVASVLGSSFVEMDMLAAIFVNTYDEGSREEMLTSLPKYVHALLKSGLIECNEQFALYRFSHDIYKYRAFNMSKQNVEYHQLHWRVGTMLLRLNESCEDNKDGMFLSAVDHLNLGSSSIDDAGEKLTLAKLNHIAGKESKRKNDFVRAAMYATTGLSLLDTDLRWKEPLYDLTLEISSFAAEMLMCGGDADQSQEMIKDILRNAHSLQDKMLAHTTNLELMGCQNEFNKAADEGLQVLQLLGLTFPNDPGPWNFLTHYWKTKRMLRGKSDDFLLALPSATDKQRLAKVKMMSTIPGYIFYSTKSSGYLPLIYLQVVQSSLTTGLCQHSVLGLAFFAALCTTVSSKKEGRRYGELSLNLLQRIESSAVSSAVRLIVVSTVSHWFEPYKDCISTLLEGHRIGLKTTKYDHAMGSAFSLSIFRYVSGANLAVLANQIAGYMKVCIELQQQMWYLRLFGLLRTVCAVRGVTLDTISFEALSSTAHDTDRKWTDCAECAGRLDVAYLFNDFDTMESHILALEKAKVVSPMAHLSMARETARLALSCIRLAQSRESRKYKAKARVYARTVQQWASEGCVNLKHVTLLIKAELSSLDRKHDRTKRLYNEAIDSAVDSGFVNDLATAYERAANFAMATEGCEYEGYLIRAHSVYQLWGATAKANQLQQCYPNILGALVKGSEGPIEMT